jgi:hypothetical protein
MLRRAAAAIAILCSAAASHATPEPWRTYTIIAEQIACPEYDRLIRANVFDGERLARTRTECLESIARDNPDLWRTLRAASAHPAPAPPPTPAEITPAAADSDLARVMPIVAPARQVVIFLLADAARLSRQQDDDPAAARIAAATAVARQLNTGNTGLEWIVAEAIHHAILDHAARGIEDTTLGPAAAGAVLDAHEAYTTIHAAHLARATRYELASALGQIRAAAADITSSVRALHSHRSLSGAALPPSLRISAALSHARACIDPIHAIRHESLLRALTVPMLNAGPARRMAGHAAIFNERYADTIAGLREIAGKDLAKTP